MRQYLIILCLSATSFACGSGAETNNLPQREVDAGTKDSPLASVLPQSAPAVRDTARLEGTWFLVASLPSDTAAGKIPFIRFDSDAKNFTGNTGCNTMRGKFSFTDSTITIGDQIISTKMACPGYNEDGFLKSLPKANHFRFENGLLILMMEATEVSRWSREPIKQTIKTA